MEGGGRSWFWDESEAVDGGLQLIGNGLGHSVALPKLERFNPRCGGLKVVYKGGAVGELPIISTKLLYVCLLKVLTFPIFSTICSPIRS